MRMLNKRLPRASTETKTVRPNFNPRTRTRAHLFSHSHIFILICSSFPQLLVLYASYTHTLLHKALYTWWIKYLTYTILAGKSPHTTKLYGTVQVCYNYIRSSYFHSILLALSSRATWNSGRVSTGYREIYTPKILFYIFNSNTYAH